MKYKLREDWQIDWEKHRSWANTFLGFMLFRLLRNDLGWALLNDSNKQWVHRANLLMNTQRPEYINPGSTPGLLTFDSKENPKIGLSGNFLLDYLNKYQPKSVIEIGPGTGFLTKQIVGFPSVRKYLGLDINQAFIDFLQPRLEEIAKTKKNFEFSLVAGDFKQENLPSSDSVVFLSAVHHIPDRVELFEKISSVLRRNGTMFCVEPTHYYPRKLAIFRKFLRGFYGKEFRSTYRSMATHNYCSKEEFETVFHKVGDLSIESCTYSRFEFPPIIKPFARAALHYLKVPRSPERWFMLSGIKHPLRFFSHRMGLTVRKQ